jgi:hypothetical protein
MESGDAVQCSGDRRWSAVAAGGGASRRSQLPLIGGQGGGVSGTHGVLFLVASTSLIWCCATGARSPSGWAPPIRELSQGPSWPPLWANWWRSILTFSPLISLYVS